MDAFGNLIGQYNSTIQSLTSGDFAAASLDSNGRLIIATSTGVPIEISDGGGAITVDGTVAATQSGAWTVAATQSGTWDIGTVTTVTTLTGITNDVNIADGGNSITVDGTFWQATQPVSLATVPSHDVTNAGTFAVQVDGDALTALQLIDNIVLAEDAAAAGGEAGVQVLAVRQDTLTSSVSADGDFASLKVNALGELYVTGSLTANVDDVFESGTEADAASDPTGDGVVAITGAAMADVVTVAVGAGETLYITGLDFSADEQSRFELIVDDDGTPSEWLRVGLVAAGAPSIHRTFPRAIEVAGAANRSVKIRAQRLQTGNANAAAAINAYKR